MGRIRPNCLHAKHGRGAAVGPVVGGMSRMLLTLVLTLVPASPTTWSCRKSLPDMMVQPVPTFWN